MKLQVNVSQEVVDEIDVIANRLGVSRSAWCALVIGEALDNRRKVSRYYEYSARYSCGLFSARAEEERI